MRTLSLSRLEHQQASMSFPKSSRLFFRLRPIKRCWKRRCLSSSRLRADSTSIGWTLWTNELWSMTRSRQNTRQYCQARCKIHERSSASVALCPESNQLKTRPASWSRWYSRRNKPYWPSSRLNKAQLRAVSTPTITIVMMIWRIYWTKETNSLHNSDNLKDLPRVQVDLDLIGRYTRRLRTFKNLMRACSQL